MFRQFNLIFFIILIPFSVYAEKPIAKTWDGLYLGANVGGMINHANIDAHHVAFTNLNGVCHQQKNYNSAFLGTQAGLSHQFDSKVVMGIEGDFNYPFSQNTQPTCTCDFYPQYYDQFTLTYRNQGSIRGRIGYSLEHHLLPYFTAGGSFANMAVSYNNEVNDHYYRSNIQPGWTIGGGLEWAYSKQLSFRVDYFYQQYNDLKTPITNIYEIYDSSGQGVFSLNSQRIQFAINYWLQEL
jgi:outer membrane immunogenic protein